MTDNKYVVAANARQRETWKVQLACVVGVAFAAAGIWANYPYLVIEHHRLELWKIAGLLIGDLMGLIWFAKFALTHAVSGNPLVPVPAEKGKRNLRLIIFTGIIAILIDLGFALYLMHEEKTGYLRGKIAEGQVLAIQEHKRPVATGYGLDCRFKDESGQQHETHLRIFAEQHLLPKGLPDSVTNILKSRDIHGNPIPVRYDPQFPVRAWIDGMGWEDENGFYWVSIGILLVQAGATTIFLLQLGKRSANGIWPWWWDIYKALPLGAEALILLGMGLIDRLMDSLY